MTKAEVYSGLIDIQKKAGQGLSGIVTVMGEYAHLFRRYLDELIEEGLVECYDCGDRLGIQKAIDGICQQKAIMFGKMA